MGKRAHLRYSTIENWSKNMYNLNTKRARVDEDGDIEWILSLIHISLASSLPWRFSPSTQLEALSLASSSGNRHAAVRP